jgi:GNAT superfamily N-acetyltransferase
MTPSPEDVAAVERSTLAALSPARLLCHGDWLLPMDMGTVGRARSAVPLRHDRPDPHDIDFIVRAYEAAGLPPWFRLPDAPGWMAFHRTLEARGLARGKPSHVMTAALADLPAAPPALPCTLSERPDPAWEAVFLGDGIDAADGAHRVRLLRQGRDCRYASVRLGGEVVSVGLATLAGGQWLGIHALRTVPRARGRGCATAILLALGEVGRARGLQRAYLQVEKANTDAVALYRRLGFACAWAYAYWR